MTESSYGIRPATVTEAIVEARRFIRAAEAANRRMTQEKRTPWKKGEIWIWPTKETAAMRRASMDLTRNWYR